MLARCSIQRPHSTERPRSGRQTLSWRKRERCGFDTGPARSYAAPVHLLGRSIAIPARPISSSFKALISLIGDVDRDLVGLALVDRSLRLIERDRHFSRWLPEPGHLCSECAILFGMDEAILRLVDGPAPSLRIPAVELMADGGSLRLDVAITWHAGRRQFIIASYPDHRLPEGEWLLANERRQKRLAEERLRALGLDVEIEQARYRHIVEAGTDLVLRFTRDRVLTFANKMARSLFDIGEQALGRPLDEVLAPRAAMAPWEKLVSRGEKLTSFEQETMAAIGDTAWIWWHVSMVGGAAGAEYQAVGRDVTALHKLREETERANANARKAAATEERLRIARELHDTLIQSSMAVLAQIRLAKAMLGANPAALPSVLASAEGTMREAIDEARGAVTEFRQPKSESVRAGLRRRFAELEQKAGVTVSLLLEPGIDEMARDLAAWLLKILDEAIRNIMRHALARSVSVEARTAHRTDGTAEVELLLRDDGVGFDPERRIDGHFGIVGMQEYAKLAGGSLAIESAAGIGTTLRIAFPLRHDP